MNEFALIAEWTAHLPTQADGLLWGVGDDCAVLTGNVARDWLLSTDQCIEGVHFQRAWAPWERIGHKAVRAAVSDIAAMGGKPRFLLITIAAPANLIADDLRACYRGIRAAAEQVGATIIGGDTSRAEVGVQLGITAIGEVPHGRAIYRRGARPGDHVYVTGHVGGAALGLALLQRGRSDMTQDRGAATDADDVLERFWQPPLRVAAGQWLLATSCVSAMMDVSDGLLADLGHLATASGVKIRIEAVRIPLCRGMTERSDQLGLDPLRTAVASGEEYELVFTVAAARSAAFRQWLIGAERTLGHPITYIGEVVEGTGVELIDPLGQPMDVPVRGYVHHVGE